MLTILLPCLALSPQPMDVAATEDPSGGAGMLLGTGTGGPGPLFANLPGVRGARPFLTCLNAGSTRPLLQARRCA